MINKNIEELKQFVLNPSFYRKSLKDMINARNRLKESFKKDNRIIVIFLVNYVPCWNKMVNLYEELKINPLFKPIIVCVPYFYRVSEIRCIKKQKNETYDYFISKGYDAVNAIDSNGKWIDLRSFNPYYVFCARPYNNCLPKCYRSGSISKHSLLCVILYGETISSSEAKEVINHGYFKNVFCYFSFDDSEKEIFIEKNKLGFKSNIQKCEALGRVGLEYILKKKKDKKDSRRKVIWTPRWSIKGGSNFFEYKDLIFGLANKYKDIDFVIRPHPLMFTNFISCGIMSQGEVCAFKEKCSNSRNIILDSEKEYIDTFWQTDLLISDFSSLLVEYLVTGKPIIYCLHSTKFVYTDIGKKLLSSLYIVNNKEELIKEFERWYDNIDNKKEERNYLINELKIEGCSKRIANKLIEYIEK